MLAGITLSIIFFIRIIPVFLLYKLSSDCVIDIGFADPFLYLGGAQAILKTGTNPFNFFPPLNFLFIALFLYLGNGTPIAPIIAITLIGWLTVLGIYLLAKELFGKRAALIAAIISGVYPSLIFYAVGFFAETLALFLIVFSFLMLLKYFLTSKHYYIFMSGILWGLASQTRGGLHYFSVFIVLAIIVNCYNRNLRSLFQPIAIFLISTYLTIFSIGSMVSPIQGQSSLNSKSGIGSLVHGANRITTSCADYGDVRGNIFYDINNCKEQWPDGSQLYSDELMQEGTFSILSKFTAFVLHEPLIYFKNSLLKLSCCFSPNQTVVIFIKTRLGSVQPFFVGAVCMGISLLYIFIICGGLLGIALSRDPFRPVFISLIIFYCLLVFFTVGNSKLRLPLMPFFIIYCSYFIMNLKETTWKKIFSHNLIMFIILIFLSNSIYKYREIMLSPPEIQVRRIELCNQLGFPKTALYLFEKNKSYVFTNDQKKRLKAAEDAARERLLKMGK
jgi:4-amino-4-deoxy-L-arabinose transferase-like glycosyltransferase